MRAEPTPSNSSPAVSARRLVVAILLLAAIPAAAGGLLDRGLEHLGLSRLETANAAYLEKARQRTLSGFLLLSAIKSSLAMLEGSTVGIGFNLQVGDLVQSVYDYVDIAWKAVLAGGTALVILKLLLQVLDMLDHWILALLLATSLATLAIGWWLPYQDWLRRILRSAAFACGLLCLAFYLLVPATLAGAMAVSDSITRPMIESAYRELDQLKQDFASQGRDRFYDLQKQAPGQKEPGVWELKDHFLKLKQRLEDFANFIEVKARSLAALTFRLTAGYIFDCIVFPLTLFFCLWPLSRAAWRLILHNSEP